MVSSSTLYVFLLRDEDIVSIDNGKTRVVVQEF